MLRFVSIYGDSLGFLFAKVYQMCLSFCEVKHGCENLSWQKLSETEKAPQYKDINKISDHSKSSTWQVYAPSHCHTQQDYIARSASHKLKQERDSRQ
jgi:hypothetical protein